MGAPPLRRALKGRRVVGKRNPDGTATLTGHDLPFDEVAAACARLDALAHAAKTAGHPDRLDHLRADLLVGMITGRYTAMTDQQILATLHATTPAKPDTTGSADHTDNPTPTTVDNGEGSTDSDNDGDADEGPDGEDLDGEVPTVRVPMTMAMAPTLTRMATVPTARSAPTVDGPDGDGPDDGSTGDEFGAGADDEPAHDQSGEDSNDAGAGRDDPDDDRADDDPPMTPPMAVPPMAVPLMATPLAAVTLAVLAPAALTARV